VLRNSINYISGFLKRFEARTGLFFSSVIIAFILLACAMIYVQPVFKLAYHGAAFSRLSEHPFDFSDSNPLRYRILSPLIGYFLFLRGPYFFLLPLIASFSFIAAVYYLCRRKNFEPVDAFFLTCFIAFSCTTLIPLIATGYTDSVTWLLLFLAFSFREKIYASASFFSLALLNHESSIVLLPALILYGDGNKNDLKTIILFLLACLPHLCYRWYVDANSITKYTVSFYLSEGNIFFTLKMLIPNLPAAAFYAFKLWWIFPLAFIAFAFSHQLYRKAIIICLILAGGLSLVVIGYDYTRMLVISFPAILLSYEWLMKNFDPLKFRKFTLALILFNFLILQYHFNYDGAQPMFPWILNKASAMLGNALN
jgi:hypothetical protein